MRYVLYGRASIAYPRVSIAYPRVSIAYPRVSIAYSSVLSADSARPDVRTIKMKHEECKNHSVRIIKAIFGFYCIHWFF